MDYRLYFLTDAGHIIFRIDLKADADEGAIDIADARADGRAMELWNRDRQVKVWPADAYARRTG